MKQNKEEDRLVSLAKRRQDVISGRGERTRGDVSDEQV